MKHPIAIRVKCEGEAHSNALIDNCSMCSPWWGRYYTCPECGSKLSSQSVCRRRGCVANSFRFERPEEED